MSKFKFLSGVFTALLLFTSLLEAEQNLSLQAPKSVIYDEILGDDFNTTTRIDAIGKELFEKTGVFVGLAVGNLSIEELLKMQEHLKAPFVLLAISKPSHKVEIVGSSGVFAFFNKEKVLSPLASEGTILPLLASGKKENINANIRAAALNGYADICEQIAAYFNVKLNSSIGNANKNTLNLLRIGIYGFICIAVLFYAQKSLRKRRRNER